MEEVVKFAAAQEALKNIMGDLVPPQKTFEETLSNTDKYAAKLTEKMAVMNDIEDNDKKLIEAMILVDKDIFLQSVKDIIGNNLFDIAKIVKCVNLANDCYIDPLKAIEIISDEVENIKTKLADFFIENIPLTKRKTDAQDMRELMNNLDITKIVPKEEKPVEANKEKWYGKIFKKIKSIFS